jgi:DNA-binding PadR family transcriptional regulator
MEGADFLKLEELILLAIAGRSEIYGLEIATEIAKASEDSVQLNYGSLYPYLNRLEKKGYITSRWEEENDRKGARRKYYQIAGMGKQSLDEAILIRQRLRQPSDISILITSQIPPERDVDKLLKILQYPEEKERLRAIHELDRFVKVEPEHHWEIMQALATFIRTNSPIEKSDSIEVDIQAALDVIGNRNIDLDSPIGSIDLHQISLRGANLIRASFKGANFMESNFTEANLMFANLREANLEGTNLMRANLMRANLTEAYLSKANLTLANLMKANLTGAYLSKADLGRANLSEANLAKANLQRANLNKVQDLTIEQLHSARNWQQAIDIPDYLKDIEDEIPF